MTTIPFVGKTFPDANHFLEYLDTIQFNAWRPRFVTMHHTGSPSLATWRSYGNRANPISDAQWMKNLASYYGNTLGWSAGPHFFFTPANFCVLSLPNKRGVHAVSFNSNSWGVECVGDFDSEPFTEELSNRYAEGLACLHLAAGLSPDPFQFNVSGLHFHRDDPKTSKTCPGKKVGKETMVRLTRAFMSRIAPGAHEDDEPMPSTTPVSRTGTVNVAKGDVLNVRDEPTTKSPVTRTLKKGDKIEITGEARNGDTLYYKIKGDDYVAARYVNLA